jgi:type IV secretion system protein TrbL
MNADVLNAVIAAFNGALEGAFTALQTYSLRLLSVLGIMHLYLTFGRMITAGGTANLTALGEFLWVACRIGVFIFITIMLGFLMDAAFLTFLQWGTAAGGGGFTLADFLNPSQTVDAGFRAAKPLLEAINNMIGWGMVWNLPTMWWLSGAYWTIVIAFGVMALAVMMTLIEMKLAMAM